MRAIAYYATTYGTCHEICTRFARGCVFCSLVRIDIHILKDCLLPLSQSYDSLYSFDAGVEYIGFGDQTCLLMPWLTPKVVRSSAGMVLAV